MRCRYLNSPNPWFAKVSSVLYYDHDGTFRGVENGIDFEDEGEFLRMKWWEVVSCSPVQSTDSEVGGN